MAQGTSIGSLFFQTGINFDGFKRDAKKGQSAMSGLFNPAIIGSAAIGAAMIKLDSDTLKFSKEFETAFAESIQENNFSYICDEVSSGKIDAWQAFIKVSHRTNKEFYNRLSELKLPDMIYEREFL